MRLEPDTHDIILQVLFFYSRRNASLPDKVGREHLFLGYVDRAIRFCFLLDYVNCLYSSKLARIPESVKQIDQQPIAQQQYRYDGAQPSYRCGVHPSVLSKSNTAVARASVL